MNLRKTSSAALATAALLLAAASPSWAATVSEPVIDGLAGPLGLAVGSDGTIYVTQSFADTVSQYRKGSLTALAEGESFPFPTGVAATGQGTATFLAGGSVHVVNPSGKVRTLANLADYEASANPDTGNAYGLQGLSDSCRADIEAAGLPEEVLGAVLPHGGGVDSNPYAVALMPTGNRIVADAASNTLVLVNPSGRVGTVAVLPPRPAEVTPEAAAQFGLPECTVELTLNFEFVPTDVEVGPSGLLYVSSLPGGPEGPSAFGPRGAVFTVNRSTGAVQQLATGFAGATDLAVTPDGEVYVTELFGGRVSRVSAGGPVEVALMEEPVAIEYSRGKLYVARGVFAGPGQVMTITP